MSEEKKLFIDEDWKSQVAAEKERLAKAGETPSPSSVGGASPTTGSPEEGKEGAATSRTGGTADGPGPPSGYPPATFGLLVSTLVTEAMIAMGQLPHPATQSMSLDRDQARFSIDMLEMLQEKTKGNLDAGEEAALRDVLHQLRLAFIAC